MNSFEGIEQPQSYYGENTGCPDAREFLRKEMTCSEDCPFPECWRDQHQKAQFFIKSRLICEDYVKGMTIENLARKYHVGQHKISEALESLATCPCA